MDDIPAHTQTEQTSNNHLEGHVRDPESLISPNGTSPASTSISGPQKMRVSDFDAPAPTKWADEDPNTDVALGTDEGRPTVAMTNETE